MAKTSRNLGGVVALLLIASTFLVGIAPSASASGTSATGASVTGASGSGASATTADRVGSAAKTAKRPSVTRVKPAKGEVVGGTRMVIKGKNFVKVRSVTVGTQRASAVDVKSPRKIVAISPPGLPGAAAVRVKTKAGVSKPKPASRFRYVDPRPSDKAVLTPEAGTVVASDVRWVTGGTDYDNPQAGQVSPWVVGIGPDGVVPAVGDQYFLAPGGEVYPAGLAGTVSVIASQADGITAVTVEPTPLDEALSEIDISSTDLGGSARRGARGWTDGGVTFKELGPSSFLCTDKNGQSASFRGSLRLSLENIAHSFELKTGNLFAKGYVSAWVRYEPVLRGKVTATGSIKCKIKPVWQNAQRRIYPIGTSGATLSFAPTASFSLSGSGTIDLTQRSRRMVGISVFDGRSRPIDVRKNLGLTVNAAALTTKVDANAGISVQFGALDRVGIEGKAVLAAEGKVTAKSNPTRACVDLFLGVKLSINLFLDVWITRWDSPGYSKSWPFAEWNKCTPGTDPAPNSEGPVVTSTRLPTAYQQESYSARLTTEDNRPGRWEIDTSRFPRGLTLDRNSGQITGVPTANVGDFAFGVTFIDGAGRRDSQIVRLYVAPPRLVSGGDIQATLTWGSTADLDLYVTDPQGETVYYGARTSSSGGQLDRDANAGCGEASTSPIENIFWPPRGAPPGQYAVAVDVYSPCDATNLNWRLVVRVRGAVVLDTTGSGNSQQYLVNVGSSPRVVQRSPAPLPQPDK
jgi:hypothetical protein